MLALAACSTPAAAPQLNIGNISTLAKQFGPEFSVKTIGPAGIDPKLLTAAPLPPGVTVDPPDCAKFGSGSTIPSGLKGNMAALTATGAGNQFVAIALETSQDVPLDPSIASKCAKVTVRGNGFVGATEVVDAPSIDGAKTLGMKRDVLNGTSGRAVGQESFSYTAYLGRYVAVVTVTPAAVGTVVPAPPDGKRAADLLVSAVAAIRG